MLHARPPTSSAARRREEELCVRSRAAAPSPTDGYWGTAHEGASTDTSRSGRRMSGHRVSRPHCRRQRRNRGMTLSRSNPRAKQRWTLLGMAIATMLLLIAGVVLAVHDEDFQLDGDVIASTTTNKGGSTQTLDWDSLINANGTPKDPLPAGFEDAGFEKDFQNSGSTFLTSDTTTFATGSKDTLPISGWQCNFDNNVNSKIDVMNAYAAAYTDPQTQDEIIYF